MAMSPLTSYLFVIIFICFQLKTCFSKCWSASSLFFADWCSILPHCCSGHSHSSRNHVPSQPHQKQVCNNLLHNVCEHQLRLELHVLKYVIVCTKCKPASVIVSILMSVEVTYFNLQWKWACFTYGTDCKSRGGATHSPFLFNTFHLFAVWNPSQPVPESILLVWPNGAAGSIAAGWG